MTWIFTYEDDRPLVTDRKGEAICSVFGNTVNEELDRGVLLAAAPDLLAGVRKALGALNAMPRRTLPEGDSYQLAVELEALIKQATKGSP